MFDVSFSLNPLDNNDISQCSNFETLSQLGHRRDRMFDEKRSLCTVEVNKSRQNFGISCYSFS